MADCTEALIAAVAQAFASKTPLYIAGGNSKRDMLGRRCEAKLLDLSGHHGIVDFQPSELVITVRAGTPLVDIEQTLAPEGLCLAFDPPQFGGTATAGGTLACNLSGPGRPWAGSIRDAVLGVRLINGRAELLKFGGQVMKNVAGYDVSRLQAGAMGTLGVITEISLKEQPQPESVASLAFEVSRQDAIETMNRRAGEPKPLTGAFWYKGRMYLRLAGSASAVENTARLWGGERLPKSTDLWTSLREMTLSLFKGDAPLWRASHKPTAPAWESPQEQLIDWCGAQRWFCGDFDLDALQGTTASAGGHIMLFRGGDRLGEVRQRLNTAEQRLQGRIKHSFDPEGIFNPGRLYSWM
jgi:glycolate oxidase FAD binding subunit